MRVPSRTRLAPAILLLTLTLFTAPVHAVMVGPNVNLIPAPDRQQAEPTIAVDPRNPNIIVAGAQDFNFNGVRQHRWHAIYRSSDGGQTWTNNLLPGFPGDTSPQGANSPLKTYDLTSDPVMIFDQGGNLYYAGIAFNVESGQSADFVAKYVNDGADYTGVALLLGFGDFPKIAIDQTGGQFDGNIYLITSLGLSVSIDGGSTFSKFINLQVRGNHANCCTGTGITVLPSGDLLIVGKGATFDSKTGQLLSTFISVTKVVFSVKGNLDEQVSNTIAAQSITELPFRFPNNQFRVETLPEIASDSSGVYIVWSDYTTGDADILFVRSTDGGATWSNPLRINDVTQGQQFNPTITTSRGIISIAWYDGRLTATINGTISSLDVFYSQSNNAGQTFVPNTRITSVSFNPNQATILDFNRNEPFIGDYISISAGNGLVHPIWSDDRNACDLLGPPNNECVDEDVYTATITV